MRNMNRTFNKEEPIEYIIKVNIYYQGHRERMEIDVIRGQKWNMILGILWLAYYNPEIDWKIEEVKMTRCLEECKKQQRPKQGKLGWEKIKERRKERERGKKIREERTKKKRKEKTKEEENDGSKESSQGVGDLG